MSNMARIEAGIVIEILKPVDGFDVVDCFHPDLIAASVPASDDVQVGWILTSNGLVPPPTEEAPAEEAPVEEAPADTPPAA